MRIALLLIFFPLLTMGQKDSTSLDELDSIVFTQDELLWYVRNYHPVAVQGKLLLQRGESEVRQARGGFDPYLHGDYNDKYFDDKNYYNLLNGGLKVPTWYGIELKTGIDQNEGVFLNPENNVPDGGLWYGGVSVALGNGLFIDDRRASLRQAQLFAASTFAEQQQLMNELYFDAIKSYWKWAEAYNNLEVYREAVELAQFRFESVKQSFILGDLPAIDTLEAKIQVQNRQISRNEAELAYQNARLELSNYLWFENNTPLILTDSIRPPVYDNIIIDPIYSLDSLERALNQLQATHPKMQLIDFKLGNLDIERRLKAEKLKPTLNLNYNFLTEPVNNEFYNNISTENYKWGVGFSFPILLREERGAFQVAKLKIRETEMEQRLTLYKLQNDLQGLYNNQLNLNQQVELYTDAVANYNKLLSGERQKFEIGESSLFLVNSRETKTIEAELKLIELIAKNKIIEAELKRATGYLFEN